MNEEDIEELKRLFYSNRLTQYGKRKLIGYYEQQIKELKEKLDETLNANLALVQGNADSIPKSLVKEKIEEYKKFLKTKNLHRWERLIANNIIDVLQELLEE